MHYLKAYVKSQNGRSQNVFYDFWAGRDVVNPGSPKAEKKENGEIVVSWTAPVKGNHDGYYNPGDVSYTVTRQPDNKVVYEGTATSYTDESAKDLQIGNYYYDIKAKVEGEYGETVSTQYIMVGSFLVLPYTQDFENNASVSTFVIEDMNEDDNTWEYFGDSMICGVSESMAENRMVAGGFSPVNTGRNYLYVCIIASMGTGYPEDFFTGLPLCEAAKLRDAVDADFFE